MNERAEAGAAFSHMALIAGCAVLLLAGVVVWQVYAMSTGSAVSAGGGEPLLPKTDRSPFASVNWQTPVDETQDPSDPDGISNIGANVVAALFGAYSLLQESGGLAPAASEMLASDVGANLRANISFTSYAPGDLKTDSDVSYERMLAYRDDMRVALEPLLQNPGYELKIFASYQESGDAAYLRQLRDTAENYETAIANAITVVVPRDAASIHAEALTSLAQFSAVVARLADHADDAFASAALVQTYNTAEARMVSAFDALAQYQKVKTP